MCQGRCPRTPAFICETLSRALLKELFREKFLKDLQKLLKKGIFLDVYSPLRHGHTRTVGIYGINPRRGRGLC